MNNLRTATVSAGITAVLQTFSLIFAGAQVGACLDYENASIKNTGDTNLYVALMPRNTAVPTAADMYTLAPGDDLPMAQLDMSRAYLATADIAGSNEVQFKGEPTFKN